MMETQETTTAVQLLAEWKRINGEGEDVAEFISTYGIESLFTYRAALKRRADSLDKIAEDAGISIIEGSFAYGSEKVHWDYKNGNGCKFLNIPAEEQQAIQEWLLIKSKIK